MTSYRLAAFDFDGTLADSFAWFVSVMGEVADRYKFRRMELADLEALRGLTARQMLSHLRLPSWKVPFVARHVRALQARDIAQIRLFDGISEMLESLIEQGVKVAIVSSNSEKNVRHVLGRSIAGSVSFYGCGASLLGKRSKLQAALRATGVPPQQAIYIGDETRDIQAAHSAGMRSGAVLWGYAAADVLMEESPTEIFERPDDIIRLASDQPSIERT